MQKGKPTVDPQPVTGKEHIGEGSEDIQQIRSYEAHVHRISILYFVVLGSSKEHLQGLEDQENRC